MAYPTLDAPYGLKPVGIVGGRAFVGSTRLIPIASGEGTAIFYGDVVKLINTGHVRVDTGTDAATPVGVFLGCQYTDPNTGQLTFKQYFPASTAASDIQAFVCDDPTVIFKVAVVSATTTIGGVAQTAIGNNAILVQNAGSTITGNSKVALGATTGTTNTFPLRVLEGVPETKNASGSFTEVLVMWNATMQAYNNATGV